MLSYFQSAYIVVAGLLVTYLLLRLTNHVWPLEHRRQHNEFIGMQINILGTLFAVILGFMLANVWTAYRQASIDASSEASADLSVYRSAGALPEAAAGPLQSLARDYAQRAVSIEWPSMQARTGHFPTGDTLSDMWKALARASKITPPGSLDSCTEALTALQTQRYNRVEQYNSHLPGILWCVLIWGSLGVTFCSLISSSVSPRLQNFYVLSTTALILLALTALADIDRPFEGGLYVQPTAFKAALTHMQ